MLSSSKNNFSRTCYQNMSQSATLFPLTTFRTNAFSYTCFSNEENQQQFQWLIKKENIFKLVGHQITPGSRVWIARWTTCLILRRTSPHITEVNTQGMHDTGSENTEHGHTFWSLLRHAGREGAFQALCVATTSPAFAWREKAWGHLSGLGMAEPC